MTEPAVPERKQILIVDDEPHVVKYLSTLLEDNGYETSSAANGKAGLAKALAVLPDLVCLDMAMPVESGVRFYRNLRDDPALAGIPVVVITAVTGKGGDPEPFQRFLSTRRQVPPPDAFLPKPIDTDEFLQTVARLLA